MRSYERCLATVQVYTLGPSGSAGALMTPSLVSVATGGIIGFLSATLVAGQNARLAAGSKLRAPFAP